MGIPEGDPEKGKKLFVQRCAHCHTIEAGGKQSHAPNLRRIVGRKAGSAPGYNDYTEANKNKSLLYLCFCCCWDFLNSKLDAGHQNDRVHNSRRPLDRIFVFLDRVILNFDLAYLILD